MKVESLIFDMDGTLWDSSENVANSWTEALIKFKGIEKKITQQDICSVMGLPMDELAGKIFGEYDEDTQMQLLDVCGEYENEYLREHGGVLYDEVEDTLRALSEKHRLFIVSNCQSGYIEAFLAHYGFGKYFVDTLCWGDTKVQKGESIKLLMQKNEITDAAYVGDIQGDCNSAYYAGIKFIHAAYGFGKVDKKDAEIHSFSELLDVVE
jgi:phosphoglycolate phosphatase